MFYAVECMRPTVYDMSIALLSNMKQQLSDCKMDRVQNLSFGSIPLVHTGRFFHVSFPCFFIFVEKSRVNYAFLQFSLRKPRLSSLYPREGNIKFYYLDKPAFIWQSNATSWVKGSWRGEYSWVFTGKRGE